MPRPRNMIPGCTVEYNIDYYGNEIRNYSGVGTSKACADLCASTDGGLFWTWNPASRKCFVKSSDSGRHQYSGAVSGNKQCGTSSD